MGRMRGFTLIELLMALVVLGLVVALTYAAIEPAGEGFKRLQDVREDLDGQLGLGWRLREDLAHVMLPIRGKAPIRINNDNRGGNAFDELVLVVADPARPGLSQVRYFIDETQGRLMRSSRYWNARTGARSVDVSLGEVSSFDVEFMDNTAHWHQRWRTGQGSFIWPRAIRIHLRDHQGRERVFLVPLLQGQRL
ncbi:MAG: prepilin-type N-terminal cleavage/methylation domain-containing protein [Zetaproteobacteria bacterium]|nr:MAG: prepilin-type N-terminal cleavage/methylation domain-containing protein [Zetaproteobacteria bacterium]